MPAAIFERVTSHPEATARRLLSVALILFALELVLGGPGFMDGGVLSPRTGLFALLTVATVAYYRSAGMQLDGWQSVSFGLLLLLIAVWVIAIPLSSSYTQLRHSIRECLFLATALTGILLIKIAQLQPVLFRSSGRALLVALDIAAVLIVTIWITGLWDDGIQLSAGTVIRQLFRPLGSTDSLAVYVGPMPDGGFRVMWITSTIVCLATVFALKQGMPLRSCLYIVACAASYARGLWIALVAGLALMMLIEVIERSGTRDRWRGRLLGGVAGLLASGALLYLHNHDPGSRLSFDDAATDIRLEQTKALIQMWSGSPWLGHGFGSFVHTLTRNSLLPWSYEMVYPALLMKLGLLGGLMVICWGGLLLRGSLGTKAKSLIVAPYFLTILTYSGTNPYLLNIVGSSAVFGVILLAICTGSPGESQTCAEARVRGKK